MTYFDLDFKVMLTKDFSVKKDFFFFLEVNVSMWRFWHVFLEPQTARNLEWGQIVAIHSHNEKKIGKTNLNFSGFIRAEREKLFDISAVGAA